MKSESLGVHTFCVLCRMCNKMFFVLCFNLNQVGTDIINPHHKMITVG